MDPVTIGLIATSALGKLGGILGQKKRKQLDPEMLKKMFGAKAISAEQMELFNHALNSAQGQQLMTGAAQQGQQLQTDLARGSAEAGLGPAGGASGGADIFAGAAGASAQGNLQRAMQSQMMEAMLPIAQQLVSDRMKAWLGDREQVLGQSSKFQDIMGAVSGLSGDLLAAKQANVSSGAEGQSGGAQLSGTGDAGQSQLAAAPAGAAPPTAGRTESPAGTQPVLAAPPMAGNVMGMNQQPNMLQGAGRFARALSARNRFGAVQTALA